MLVIFFICVNNFNKIDSLSGLWLTDAEVWFYFEMLLLNCRLVNYANGKSPKVTPSVLYVTHVCVFITKTKKFNKIDYININDQFLTDKQT